MQHRRYGHGQVVPNFINTSLSWIPLSPKCRADQLAQTVEFRASKETVSSSGTQETLGGAEGEVYLFALLGTFNCLFNIKQITLITYSGK